MLPHHAATYAKVYSVAVVQSSIIAIAHSLAEVATAAPAAPLPLQDVLREQLPVVLAALEAIGSLTEVSLENAAKQQEYN